MKNAPREPTPPPDLCDALAAAADRLLAGTPLHSDGKLTIVSLAQEARIKRWLLTHKYPHQLKDKYQAMFKAVGDKSGPVNAAEHNAQTLRLELRRARDDNRYLEQLTRAYATVIDQLAAELADVTAERDVPRGATSITRLPRRDHPGRRNHRVEE